MEEKKITTTQIVNLKLNKTIQTCQTSVQQIVTSILTMMQNIHHLRNESTQPNYHDLLTNNTRRY